MTRWTREASPGTWMERLPGHPGSIQPGQTETAFMAFTWAFTWGLPGRLPGRLPGGLPGHLPGRLPGRACLCIVVLRGFYCFLLFICIF